LTDLGKIWRRKLPRNVAYYSLDFVKIDSTLFKGVDDILSLFSPFYIDDIHAMLPNKCEFLCDLVQRKSSFARGMHEMFLKFSSTHRKIE